MDLRGQMRDVPRALRDTIEKGRPQFEALVRETRWGEWPVYLVGSGQSFLVALAGVYAWERLLGWPVVARPAAIFEAYSCSAVRPRSVLVAISTAGEADDETVEAARAARSRGAVVLVLTGNPDSPLAAMADGVFRVDSGESGGTFLTSLLCHHAALNYIGLTAARALKRHHPQLDVMEEEFHKLPDHLDWMLTQLPDAVRSLRVHLEGARNLWVVGAGAYHPAALVAAHSLWTLAGIRATGFDATEFLHGPGVTKAPDTALVLLSGSGCRLKKAVVEAARWAKKAQATILSVTDANDRQLIDNSLVGVLLPSLTEIAGSTLSLGLLEWVVSEIGLRQNQAATPAGTDSLKQPSRR